MLDRIESRMAYLETKLGPVLIWYGADDHPSSPAVKSGVKFVHQFRDGERC